MSTNAEIETDDTAEEEAGDTRRRMHPEVKALNDILRILDRVAAERGASAAERVSHYAASVFNEHENQI